MPAKYFNFVDGQRLPGDRVKEFLMNQAVIQCANQTEITSSGIESFGARVAMNLEDGQIWTYAGDPAAWAPAQNALDLDLLDQRYLTRIAADGIYLTDTQAGQKYLTILSAQGLYLTEGQADGKYLTPSQANALYLTPLDADSRYLTLISAGQIYLRQDAADTAYQKKPTTGTFITDIQAGQIYLSQTTASQTYLTQIGAGTLYLDKGTYLSPNSTTIDGGKITTNSINVNRLVAGTLTGFRVQTSSSGQRVVMSESTNSLSFWNSGGSEVGRLTGLTAMNYDSTSNHAFQVNGSTVFSVTSSGVSLSPGASFNSDINSTGTIRAAGQLSSNGGFAGGGITMGSNILAAGNIEASGTVIGGFISANNLSTTTSTTIPIVRYNGNGSGVVPLLRSTSDRRVKTEIETIPSALDIVNDLRPVTYKSLVDEGDEIYAGFIAQEVEEAFANLPVSVTTDAGDELEGFDLSEGPLKGFNADVLIPYLVKSIQELSAKNDALEARIAALEGGAQ